MISLLLVISQTMQQGAKLLRSEGVYMITGIEFSIYFFLNLRLTEPKLII